MNGWRKNNYKIKENIQKQFNEDDKKQYVMLYKWVTLFHLILLCIKIHVHFFVLKYKYVVVVSSTYAHLQKSLNQHNICGSCGVEDEKDVGSGKFSMSEYWGWMEN